MQGERLQNTAPTQEEQAAAEFMTVQGVGEGTAMALALTTALGQQQHTSLQCLKAWVQSSSDNAAALQTFLLTR